MEKIKKILIFVLIILIFGALYSYFKADINPSSISKNAILWDKNIKIKPSDFQAEVDTNSDPNARMYWHHDFYLTDDNIKKAEITSYFDKNKSWIRDTINFQKEMKLQKLYFNVYESYARNFNKEIYKLNNKIPTTDLENIKQKINAELKKTQDSIYFDLRNAEGSRSNPFPDAGVINYWKNKIDKRLAN